jgi:hypothetical protein
MQVKGSQRFLRKHYRRVIQISVLFLLGLPLLTSLVGKSKIGQEKVNLFVEEPRPVAAAVKVLEANCGCVITYEDPRYFHDGEVADVTQSVRKDLDKYRPGEAPRVIVPKGGALAVDYDAFPGTKAPINTLATIQQLLNNHANAGGSGRFRVEQQGEIFHVIPNAFKNYSGEMTPQQSLLDTVISLSPEERSGTQTLKALCSAISQQSQALVLVGTIPVNRFLHYRDNRELKSEKARDALVDLLRSVDPKGNLSWQLLGGPGPDPYYLNIHRVTPLR